MQAQTLRGFSTNYAGQQELPGVFLWGGNRKLRLFQLFFLARNRGFRYNGAKQNNSEERKETDMTLGERIQACRKRAGLSQEALAEQLQVSRQAVSKWELDSAQPDLDKVVAMCRIFGITTDALLLGTEAAPVPEPAPGTAPPPPPAAEKAPPRWYLLGIIPLAVGVFFLGRGLIALFVLLQFLEFSRQMLG